MGPHFSSSIPKSVVFHVDDGQFTQKFFGSKLSTVLILLGFSCLHMSFDVYKFHGENFICGIDTGSFSLSGDFMDPDVPRASE